MIEEYSIPQPDRTQDYVNFSLKNIRECTHNFQLTQSKQSNGVLQFKVRCVICGESKGGAIKYADLTDKQKNDAVLWNPQTATDYYAENARLRKEAMEEAQRDCDASNSQKNQAWWRWYSAYLASSTWRIRRQSVMRRARGICEACQIAAATEVHHLTYAHVGREPLFELVAICLKCHEQITSWDRG